MDTIANISKEDFISAYVYDLRRFFHDRSINSESKAELKNKAKTFFLSYKQLHIMMGIKTPAWLKMDELENLVNEIAVEVVSDRMSLADVDHG